MTTASAPAGKAAREGTLLARPALRRTKGPYDSGTITLKPENGRGGLLHVPPGLDLDRPGPLLVMLHGAGATAWDVLPMVAECADRFSVLTVLPESRGATWDMLLRGFGPDVAYLDGMLADAFARYPVDPERIALAGFSDGASYALSLGIMNGELFSDIIAFSPGFAAPGRVEDAPRIFLSHGREDPVLPIDRCGRPTAARLERAGFDIEVHEFVGGHVVPREMVEAAFDRFLSSR